MVLEYFQNRHWTSLIQNLEEGKCLRSFGSGGQLWSEVSQVPTNTSIFCVLRDEATHFCQFYVHVSHSSDYLQTS